MTKDMGYIVDRAICLQSCPQLAFIERTDARYDHDPSPMLAKAMAKGHLPSWKTLDFCNGGGVPNLVKSIEAGHLDRVKELRFCLSDVRDPSDVYSLLRAFQGREEKLDVLHVTLHNQDDHDFQLSYHELLSSPACSDLRKLVVSPREDVISMLFVSDYLKKGARNGGWPSLRALHFTSLYIDEDIYCLADALLLGGEGGPAPNLEELSFEFLEEDTIELPGSDLFVRGALANITTLTFTSVDFTKQSMAALIDGFRKSGHKGRHLKRFLFDGAL